MPNVPNPSDAEVTWEMVIARLLELVDRLDRVETFVDSIVIERDLEPQFDHRP